MMYGTYMLIRTMPRYKTWGLCTRATVFLHCDGKGQDKDGKPKKGERTKTRIQGAPAVHVRSDGIASGQAKVRKLDNDFALTDTVMIEGVTINPLA
jgi:hypothetical protein